jgi:hypothetical protein
LYTPINNQKLVVLQALYQQALQQYQNDKDAAAAIMASGKKSVRPEEAALVIVANALLNLDEVVTKS